MNVAAWPGTVHSLKSMMWCSLLTESSVLTASPIARVDAWIGEVMSFVLGAKSAVVRPGGGSPHAHETRPEQSDRYGSHAGLLCRMQTEGQEGSIESSAPFGLWQ